MCRLTKWGRRMADPDEIRSWMRDLTGKENPTSKEFARAMVEHYGPEETKAWALRLLALLSKNAHLN